MHVIPWHLRRGQALPEGVHVIVLQVQRGEPHLLLPLLSVRVRPEAVQLRGQPATGGRCEAQETLVTAHC